MNEALVLDASLFCNMAIGRHLKDSEAPVLGVDFSVDGTILAAYTAETLHLYDMATAKKAKTLKNTISRIAILRFTHSPTLVVFVPQEEPQDILLWSIYENEIIKSFKGPSIGRIIGLSLNPTSDLLLATDERCESRIYDLSSLQQEPQAILKMPGEVDSLVATFDHLGRGIFVGYTHIIAGVKSGHISHFEYQAGLAKPLATLKLASSDRLFSIKADFHGKAIAVLDKRNVLTVIQSSLKRTMYEIRMPPLVGTVHSEFSFSPDSRFLLSGEEDGSLKIYDVEKGTEIARYSNHVGPCLCVKFSPAHVLFVSACHKIILWIPKYWEKV